MHNLSREYVFLFNTLTSLEQSLAELRDQLIAAQRQAEEMYMNDPEDAENAGEVSGELAGQCLS